jgi:hypothetical protein
MATIMEKDVKDGWYEIVGVKPDGKNCAGGAVGRVGSTEPLLVFVVDGRAVSWTYGGWKVGESVSESRWMIAPLKASGLGDETEAQAAFSVRRKHLDAAWASFEKGLDDMVREEEAAFRSVMTATLERAADELLTTSKKIEFVLKLIQEATEAAQARAAEILVSARALADAERAHAALPTLGEQIQKARREAMTRELERER